ncbi:uncharacterized protein NECHADRAFT_84488 [Fusarium vanettenii 77-13-4]|uniref:Uncharacterized protein n=1 Tax=Fusarium vanettenii (strain ATCC MYA-4622 / CBS 123669 / FGSC 9596 / NRRL 45880 / 77-13-4) TaxID=660122 RepID=C7ZD90_FUSV7|nr:uncharacterized protein NECHADRAFT_84488 [Fusarium vanettenii 77-13-4]EEU38051.1 hypothetical protein NECHADRAFT_84488 [Fusarium vanettenii 77-13-4]
MANTDKVDTETQVLNDVQGPLKTLQLYRRAALGKKHLFATSTADAAEYFIVNPVPQKHHDTWRPILYKGDNPKYTSSKAIARARRTSMWNSFRLQVGDGVHEIMENKRRKKEKREYRIGQKFRKWFCMGPTPPKKELEEQQEVQGLVFPVEMKRSRFWSRTLKWELGGQEYRWTGTRRFRTGRTKNWKGISHDFKLVSSDGTVIATLEKDRWATFRRSEKTGQPPNKKKALLGALRIYSLPECNAEELQLPAKYEAAMNGEASKSKKKEVAKLNPKGPHSGNLTEEMIVFTCWIAVEGEHRLRYKIFDLLEEIAEYFKE